MDLSEHFTLEEAIVSQAAARNGLDNTPTKDVLETMLATAVKAEKVRTLLNAPMHVNSWYRAPAVNKAAGSKTHLSQHITGEAIDFICPKYGTPADICKAIVANADLIRFDQLILEHTWVHISFAILSRKPRGQVLTLQSDGSYKPGLTTPTGQPIK